MKNRGFCIALLTASLAATSWGLSITTGSNLGTSPIGYDQISLNASGGTGNYTWTLTSGVLPTGLNIATIPGSAPSQIGLVGIATQPGNYSFTLNVNDGNTNQSQAFTAKITGLTLKDTSVPDAFVNTESSYTFTPLNNAGAVTFAVTSPAPPMGVTLSSAGVLSGMPTTAGNYQINFKIFDGVDTVFRGCQLSVYALDITSPGALPNATIGVAYSTALSTVGGAGAYTYSLTGGGLPPGLSLSPGGAITGTISSAGTGLYGFDVTVSDSSHNSYQKAVSIDVLGAQAAQSQITLGTIDDAVLGNGYGWQIPLCCGGTAPFTWTATGLPPGLSLRYGSGVTSDYIYPGWSEIWGVPTAAGNYTVTVTVTDSLGASSSLAFPFHVSVLSLGPNYNLQNGTLNTPYSNTFEIEGGKSPFTVVEVPQVNGFLPDGLSLNTSADASGNFTVAGTPLENGSFDPLFKITDSAGNTLTRNNFFNINTVAGGITINNNGNLGTVLTGSNYSNQLSACCVANYVWSAPNGLPTGLSISAGGLLSGSISTSGSYTFFIKAADAAGVAAAGFRQFTLIVTPVSISTNNSLPYGNVGAAYSEPLAAAGGTGTLSWSVASGYYLPPGLTLSSNGTLSGTPTLTGQFFFAITVTDQNSNSSIAYFNMSVYAAGQAPAVSFGFGSNIGTYLLGTDFIALPANGGNGTYTWTLVSGSLPPGLALRTDVPTFFSPNAQAGLIGVATGTGNYNFTLMVSSAGSSATQAITMRVTALTLEDATPPDGFVNTPFSYTFTPNMGGVTFAVNSNSTNGKMPPGLTLSSTGVLSGTPTAAGNYTIAMNISDSADTVYQQYELYIYAINITGSAILPNTTQNTAYSTALTASGGAGGYTFTTSGGLPGGLTLAPNGTISGNTGGDGPGLYGFTVTVTDSANNSYTKRMGVDVLASPGVPMRINNLVNSDPTMGDHYGLVQNVCCGGTAPFTWTVTGLPPGMTYGPSDTSYNNYGGNPGGAQIYGVPGAAGTYNVTYTATDATGASTSLTIPMHVSVLDVALPTGSAYSLPNGTINIPYSATFHVIGGTGPYSFTQTNGELPDGLTINSSTLTVSGTPLENGSNFVNPGFEYSDSATNTDTLFRYENISIGGGTSNIQINSNGYNGYYLGTTPLNAFYSTQFSACCANSYVWSVAAGSTLPAGLSLSASGQLSGTPTKAGTYTFLVDAANSSSLSDVGVKSFVLVVTPISITTSSLPYGDVGTPYGASLFATGGAGTLTWTQTFLQGSQLPPGLSLSSSGIISGTPTSAGSFNITALATDSNGNTSIRNLAITIYQSGPPPLSFPIGPTLGPYAVGPNQVMIQLVASGGTPPYHYSITPGTPAILGLRVQDGQPLPTTFPSTVTGGLLGLLGPGNYSTSLRVTDSAGAKVDSPVNFSVLPVDVVSNGSLPTAVLNAPYSFQFTGYGGSGTYKWTGTGLPPGLSLSSSGLLSGTPTSAGTFNFSPSIADAAGGGSISRGETLIVSPFAITDSPVLPVATAGTAYSHQFSAPGCGSNCTWSGGLPQFAGVTLNSSGLLSGTYTGASGSEFTFTVLASSSAGTTVKLFTLAIQPTTPASLTIINPFNNGIAPVTLTQGINYSYALGASGGVPPYTFTLASGTLPPGISIQGPGQTLGNLDPGFTYFIGRAMAPGTYNFGLQVIDSASNGATASFAVQVSNMEILYTSLPIPGNPLVLNGAYTQPMLVVGGNGNYTSWTTSGAIYPGLSVNPSTGVITGSPTTSTSQSSVWTVTDGAGNTLSNLVSIGSSLQGQTITFGPLSNSVLGSTAAPLSATASSGLTVTFASSTPTYCTVTGVTITLLAEGTCSITASQGGNGTYAAATAVTQSFAITSPGAVPAAFFTGQASVGSGVEYLQFPNGTVFGYYTFVASSIFYHYEMGFEAFVPGSASDIYLYDFTSGHWWYTSNTLFPYLYDFTLNTWIYYFPNTNSPGHYTNPRYFANLSTGQIFPM